ncbi:hypothetical protein F5Y04DRAFT_282935 [Hypomontagnella monticulosa]|nr:hypothetical protein F5Y04DRAFT_282935 [Hypomontagnella monticulosa]
MPGPIIPTPEEIAYMLSRPDDSLVPNIIACCAICMTAATIFIGLRLWSRRIVRGRLQLDVSDWFAVAAWIVYLPYTVCLALITRYGGGKHIVFVTDPRMLGILTIVDECLYVTTLALLKFSILSLYRKIFASSVIFYRFTWVVTAMVAEWLLQVLIATNLQCIPIEASWDLNVKGTCINYGVEALVAYIINITTDLVILSMPIPIVLKLNASKSQKRRLIISFAAGGSACVVSLVQLSYITNLGSSADASWTVIPSAMLADVEIMIAFLATSIATYRPLYRFIFKDSNPTKYGYSANSGSASYGGYKRNQYGTKVQVGTGVTNSISTHSRHGITVTDHIELTRHDNVRGSWVRVHDEPEPFPDHHHTGKGNIGPFVGK